MDVEKTPAPTCTCPSGDGSLRSPCPAHGALPAINLQHEPLGFVLFPLSPAAVAPHVAEYIIGFDFDEVRDVYGVRFAEFWRGLVGKFAGQPAGQVPDGVWEALQRIIENSALHGPASNEDAILVARYRRDLLAARQPGTQEPDPTLLRFYQVTDYPSLVSALESHVLKLIDTCARNVKPWEDTFPPTLLPKWQRQQAARGIDLGQLRALAEKFESYGDDEIGGAFSGPYYQCATELRGLIDGQRDAASGVGA